MLSVPALVLVASLLPASPQAGDPAGRLAVLEQTMDRFYRGERLDAALERVNRGVQSYNQRTRDLKASTEGERAQLDDLLADVQKDRARLESMDQEMAKVTDNVVLDRKIRERNAFVQKVNEKATKVGRAVDAYNQRVKAGQAALEADRVRVMKAQEVVHERLAAFEAFTNAGKDAAFFQDLNQLLADLRGHLRRQPGDPSAQKFLARVRGLRRELAAWAVEGQARLPNGLVVVETRVEDEPCWFIVDSGAMDTILSAEIVEAIGQQEALGKQTTVSVVGGVRVTGLAFRIPRLEAAGQAQTDVSAVVMRPSDVGIDGLLGQSFLNAFRVTLDKAATEKLHLQPLR